MTLVNIEVTVKITVKQLKNVIAEASKKKKAKEPKNVDEFVKYLEQNGFVHAQTPGAQNDDVRKYTSKRFDLTFYVNFKHKNVSVDRPAKGQTSVFLVSVRNAVELVENARSLSDLGQVGGVFKYTRSFATTYSSDSTHFLNNSFNITKTVDGLLLFPGDIITVVDDGDGKVVWAELNGMPVQIDKSAFTWRNFERLTHNVDVMKLKFRERMGMSVTIMVRGENQDDYSRHLTTDFIDGVSSALKLAQCDIINREPRAQSVAFDIEFGRSFDPYVLVSLVDEFADEYYGSAGVTYYFKDH